MLSRVLFATDLSAASDLAVECLAGWRELGLHKVVVAHVHDVRRSGGLEDRLREAHAPKLERQAGRLRDAGLFARWRFEVGIPYLELDRIAAEEGCEALALGSHGATWVKEVLLGSIADAILRHCSHPALVIPVNRLAGLPREACQEMCAGLAGRILLAVDRSAEAARAVAVVERLCRRHRPAVHVVHVRGRRSPLGAVAPGRVGELAEDARARLRRVASALEAAGAAAVSVGEAEGRPARAILEAVAGWGASLVVVPRAGHGGRPRPGSTAHDVARESPVPVLVVPGKPGE